MSRGWLAGRVDRLWRHSQIYSRTALAPLLVSFKSIVRLLDLVKFIVFFVNY